MHICFRQNKESDIFPDIPNRKNKVENFKFVLNRINLRLPFQHMLFNQNFYLIFMNKICSKKGPGESWYAKKLIFLKSPYKFRFIQIFLTDFTLNVAAIFPDLCSFPILLFQSKVFRYSIHSRLSPSFSNSKVFF